MATPQSRFKEDALHEPIAGLVDEMLACYSDWREDGGVARDAYRRWSAAPASERARWFSAYRA
jgi:hypothetical protein